MFRAKEDNSCNCNCTSIICFNIKIQRLPTSIIYTSINKPTLVQLYMINNDTK